MSWQEITASEISAGKPLKTGLFSDLKARDEANVSKPFYIPIDLNGTPTTSYSVAGTYYLYVPEDAKTLRIRVALWTGSGTVYAKARIQLLSGAAGSEDSNEVSSTATAKGSPGGSSDKTFTFSDLTDISGDNLRGQEAKLEILWKHAAGSVTCDMESSTWPPSRFGYS